MISQQEVTYKPMRNGYCNSSARAAQSCTVILLVSHASLDILAIESFGLEQCQLLSGAHLDDPQIQLELRHAHLCTHMHSCVPL